MQPCMTESKSSFVTFYDIWRKLQWNMTFVMFYCIWRYVWRNLKALASCSITYDGLWTIERRTCSITYNGIHDGKLHITEYMTENVFRYMFRHISIIIYSVIALASCSITYDGIWTIERRTCSITYNGIHFPSYIYYIRHVLLYMTETQTHHI